MLTVLRECRHAIINTNSKIKERDTIQKNTNTIQIVFQCNANAILVQYYYNTETILIQY